MPACRYLQRESCCELEMDGSVEHILNRDEVRSSQSLAPRCLLHRVAPAVLPAALASMSSDGRTCRSQDDSLGGSCRAPSSHAAFWLRRKSSQPSPTSSPPQPCSTALAGSMHLTTGTRAPVPSTTPTMPSSTTCSRSTSVAMLQLERRSLKEAGPEVKMVESLAPMWDEQRARDHGATPPGGPPSPPRTPAPLCPAITEHVRAQFQACSPLRTPAPNTRSRCPSEDPNPAPCLPSPSMSCQCQAGYPVSTAAAGVCGQVWLLPVG